MSKLLIIKSLFGFVLFSSHLLYCENLYLHFFLQNENGPIRDVKSMAIIENTGFWGRIDTTLGEIVVRTDISKLSDEFFLWCVSPGHNSRRIQIDKASVLNKANEWPGMDGKHVDLGDKILEKSPETIRLVEIGCKVQSSISDTIALKKLALFSTVYNTRNVSNNPNEVEGYVPITSKQKKAYFLVWEKYYKSYGFELLMSAFYPGDSLKHNNIILHPSDLKRVDFNVKGKFILTIDGDTINSPIYFGEGGNYPYGTYDFCARDGFFKYAQFRDTIDANTNENYYIQLANYAPQISLVDFPSHTFINYFKIELSFPVKIVESFNYCFRIANRNKSERLKSDEIIVEDYKNNKISLRWFVPTDTTIVKSNTGTDSSDVKVITGYIKIPTSYLFENSFLSTAGGNFRIDFFAYPFFPNLSHKPFLISSLNCDYHPMLFAESWVGGNASIFDFSKKGVSDFFVSFNNFGISFDALVLKYQKKSSNDYRYFRKFGVIGGIDFNYDACGKYLSSNNYFSLFSGISYFNSRYIIAKTNLVCGEYLMGQVRYFDNSVEGKDQFGFRFEPGVALEHSNSNFKLALKYIVWPLHVGTQNENGEKEINWAIANGLGFEMGVPMYKFFLSMSVESLRYPRVGNIGRYSISLKYLL